MLAAIPDVAAIYLFGSYAYGEPGPESDLDIYVVAPREISFSDEAYMKIIMGLHAEVGAYDLLIREKKVFDERKPFPTLERKILREGILLYGIQ